LLRMSGGDARRLLNAVELAATQRITLEIAEESIQKRSIRYDKSSDEHYDHISAFIKSMRGSDPDAAVYWMAKMLSAGEDPRFIARRILICAAEDVGNADPQALILAASTLQAVEFVGMPEARIPLAQAALYVACAPKSNACYTAIHAATKEVEQGPKREVPNHLKNSNQGYLYPHDYPNHHVKQEYLPYPKIFYQPSDQGKERGKG
ncbi:MAG: replication-associated recombination protein A, partial [Elusimicrobia bacterium]|nr:replication-associated recombination protein A [Elusimicrobiota bacterium]